MNITHYITARQTGKSTKAAALFNEHCSRETYVVVRNLDQKYNFNTKFNVPLSQILIPRDIVMGQLAFKCLIIDEYLSIYHNDRNKVEFQEILYHMRPENDGIFLLSTPDRKYTLMDISEDGCLFLNPNESRFNLNVISGAKRLSDLGFRRIYKEQQERLHYFNRTSEEMECQLLGLYLVDQEFEDGFHIPKPKKFSLK